MRRAGCRGRLRASRPSPAIPPSPNLHPPPPESSPNPVLLGFHGGFITETRLITSLAFGDWTHCPVSPLPRGWGGIEGSSPLITWLAPGPPMPIPGCGPQVISVASQKISLCLSSLRKGHGFKLCAMNGDRHLHGFLNLNHNITGVGSWPHSLPGPSSLPTVPSALSSWMRWQFSRKLSVVWYLAFQFPQDPPQGWSFCPQVAFPELEVGGDGGVLNWIHNLIFFCFLKYSWFTMLYY